ncbi:MAG: type II CAAX endopeptidase family protein [Zavarzinella sp.]
MSTQDEPAPLPEANDGAGVPPPLPRRRGRRRDYVVAPRKPGFRLGMACVWTLLYFGISQLIGSLIMLPVMLYVIIEKTRQNPQLQGNPEATAKFMEDIFKDPAMVNATMVGLAFTQLLGLAFAILMLRYHSGRGWVARVALNRLPSGRHLLLILIGMVGLLSLSTGFDAGVSWLAERFEQAFGKVDIPGLDEMTELFKPLWWPVGLFVVGVMPGIGEEMWFRAYLGQGMGQRYRSIWPSVISCSILFGAVHIIPAQAMGAFLMGIFLHLSYIATRSLWTPILMHFLNNGLIILHLNQGLGVPILQPFEDQLLLNPTMFLLASALLVACCGYALYQTRCYLEKKEEPGSDGNAITTETSGEILSEDNVAKAKPWQPSLSGVEVPPPDSGYVVASKPLSLQADFIVLVGIVVYAAVFFIK